MQQLHGIHRFRITFTASFDSPDLYRDIDSLKTDQNGIAYESLPVIESFERSVRMSSFSMRASPLDWCRICPSSL